MIEMIIENKQPVDPPAYLIIGFTSLNDYNKL